MYNEQEKVRYDDLANVWRDAEHCRSYQLLTWIEEFFRDRRQLKTRPERSTLQGRPPSSS
jgi:sensor domain CHASE-containing protein